MDIKVKRYPLSFEEGESAPFRDVGRHTWILGASKEGSSLCFQSVCCCCLLLQYLIQSRCACGGRRIVEGCAGCLFVCVCAPVVTSSGNDRVLERASWMIRRQASQSKLDCKDQVLCLIFCPLEFNTVDPVDILATRSGHMRSLRQGERELPPPTHPTPPPSLSLSLSFSLLLSRSRSLSRSLTRSLSQHW
jgi:hypothetical protein